jgi:hypothetical protein
MSACLDDLEDGEIICLVPDERSQPQSNRCSGSGTRTRVPSPPPPPPPELLSAERKPKKPKKQQKHTSQAASVAPANPGDSNAAAAATAAVPGFVDVYGANVSLRRCAALNCVHTCCLGYVLHMPELNHRSPIFCRHVLVWKSRRSAPSSSGMFNSWSCGCWVTRCLPAGYF